MGIGIFLLTFSFIASWGDFTQGPEEALSSEASGVQSSFSPHHDAKRFQEFIRSLGGEDNPRLGAVSDDFLQTRVNRLFSNWSMIEKWEDQDWFLGFGRADSGEFLILAWKNNERVAELSIEDLSRLYLDESMSEISSPEDLLKWQSRRDQLMKALIDVRKNHSRSEVLSPEYSSDFADRTSSFLVKTSPTVLVVYPPNYLSATASID